LQTAERNDSFVSASPGLRRLLVFAWTVLADVPTDARAAPGATSVYL
jgi:hypothetical protein